MKDAEGKGGGGGGGWSGEFIWHVNLNLPPKLYSELLIRRERNRKGVLSITTQLIQPYEPLHRVLEVRGLKSCNVDVSLAVSKNFTASKSLARVKSLAASKSSAARKIISSE